MRFHRYSLEGPVNHFVHLRTNGELVLGEEEAELFNELDAATRENIADLVSNGPRETERRIREAIA
ncbi:hypothetical protein AWB80_08462 [Caballeronia pedi]|uniref:Uncharacterized protein n=1 Tax=Caballeronia pedi TaxID=1777141 RepID=A0A158E855_9BURK|nr:hypothetical protein [Caballeronia pedi]SAL02890.1 hypothetical protein AWB80_08462 [Caballeronia pedi]